MFEDPVLPKAYVITQEMQKKINYGSSSDIYLFYWLPVEFQVHLKLKPQAALNGPSHPRARQGAPQSGKNERHCSKHRVQLNKFVKMTVQLY